MGGSKGRTAPAGLLLAAVAALLALAAPAAALRWERVGGVPRNASLETRAAGSHNINFPNLSIWPSSGVGLLSTQAPKLEQYLTTNGGRNWTRVSSHYIDGVFMAGNQTAFGLGQLAAQQNTKQPTHLLKWSRASNSWTVSLRPPAGSGAVGVAVRSVAVTTVGQTVVAYVLGSLQWRGSNGALTVTKPDGFENQHIWRYNATTDSWTVIRQVDSKEDSALFNGVTAGPGGSAAFASYRSGGRVEFFSGASWKTSRASRAEEDVYVKAVAPSRAFAELQPWDFSEEAQVLHFNGSTWAKKLGAAQDIGCPSLLASAPDFALFSSQDWECAFRYHRLWRWDPAKRAFANDFNFTSATAFDLYGSDTVAHASSDKWAVFANTVEVPVMPTPPRRSFRLEARVWNGAKWAAVQPLGGLASQYVHAVVSLPSGGAVVGFQSAAGVWRLV